jgi:hypothetical protein
MQRGPAFPGRLVAFTSPVELRTLPTSGKVGEAVKRLGTRLTAANQPHFLNGTALSGVAFGEGL